MEPFTALAALLPLLTSAGQAAIQRWIAPDTFKPTNLADYLGLKNADVELFKAINAAGGSGPTYQWVEAVIRLMRPSVALIVLITWAVTHLSIYASGVDGAEVNTQSVDNFASAIGFYLFGDRTLFYAKRNA